MALGSSDVYSQANPGLATVLGSGMGPLHIIQQHAAQLARENARKAKAKAELERSLTAPVLNMNGSQYYQDEVNASAKTTAAKLRELSLAAVEGKITRSDYLIGAQEEAARHNGLVQRSADAGAALDKFKSSAKTNNLNLGKLGDAINTVLYDPETGARTSVNQFDASKLDAFNTNPDYIDSAAAINDFLDKAQLSHKAEYTQAARPGVAGMHYSMDARRLPFADDGRGQPLMIRRADGRMVPKIDNIEAIDQLANNHPQVAAILRKQYEQGLTPSAAALINGEPAQPPRSQQQTLADLLRPYGSINTNRQELSPKAVPKPSTAAANKARPIVSAPTEGEYVAGGQVPDGQERTGLNVQHVRADGSVGYDPSAIMGTTLQNKLAVSGYSMAAPTHGKPGTQPKPYDTGINGAAFRQALVQGENGTYQWRNNIDKPFIGSFGDAISLPINKATGQPITPNDKAAYEKALRDPNNDAQSFVQVITPKNKNFTADYGQRLAQLKRERARQQDGDILGKGHYSTDAELIDQAREDATGGTTISYVPNTGQNARTIDNLTEGTYKAHRSGVAGHVRRVRSAQPQSAPARPTFLKTKSAGTSAQTPARKTGGMFD